MNFLKNVKLKKEHFKTTACDKVNGYFHIKLRS